MSLSIEIDPVQRGLISSEFSTSSQPVTIFNSGDRIQNPTFLQALYMAEISRISITREQIDLYIAKRTDCKVLLSDQHVLAEVLEQSGGPVDCFRNAFPNIFK